MLKSIELYGFKSFADRTRMEFDEGVCALVGPNGSGKSNVVDAIKWALGEQSAKRLRGDEMADVIFNGSASRQPLGSAEVTLTFDNAKRQLPLDVDEIHLTRRVYRSGESEYLINGQASRLKDLRELIGGAGLGSQGYAVIEQGRVEALLQSSSAQRRAVLEEAAGVSRFNAKKQEVARRLERVEQNLLRLSDVVGEIESQLRKTKAQAGKAERYRAYAARLQKLRTEVSLYEWRLKTAERDQLNEETGNYSEFETDVSSKIESGEAEQADLTAQLTSIEDKLRQAETELSATREKIAAEESAVEFQVGRIAEWRAEAVQNAAQACELTSKGADGDASTRQTRAELNEARAKIDEIKNAFALENAELDKLAAKEAELTRRGDDVRKDVQEKNGEISRFSGVLAGLEARRRTLEQSRAQKSRESKEVEDRQKELAGEIQSLNEEEAKLEAKRVDSYARLTDLKRRREDLRRELGARQVEFSDLERKRAAYDERSTILKDLLRKYEGLSPGVKETLSAMRDPNSPFRHAYGLVADLIRVNVEAAPLIELALGQTAQYVVVPPEPELFRHIELNGAQFAGRVGFIWLDPKPDASIPFDPRLEKSEGVLGRADQFVETEPRFSALVQRLLHRTWIVESIAVAKRLYRDASEPVNFLSADGSLLTADGTLVVGSSQGGAGLISRRSELTTLSEETEKLDGEFERIQDEVALLKSDLATADAEFEKEAGVQRDVKQALDDLRPRQSAAIERETQLNARSEQFVKELQDLAQELAKTLGEHTAQKQAKDQFDLSVAQLVQEESELQAELARTTTDRQNRSKKSTNLKIELAKAEERVVFLADKLKNLVESQDEQSRRAVEHQNRAAALEKRIAESELAALNGESTIAELYWKKETLLERRRQAANDRARVERLRSKASYDLRQNREALEKRREQNRTKELSLERFAQEIKSLEERMKEDYNLDLSEVEFKIEGIDAPAPSTSPDSEAGRGKENADAAQTIDDSRELIVPNDPAGAKKRRKEIEELRVKLRDLGSVNLEAIETLETLKARYTTLFNQYNDLVAARKSIQKIVDRVNADCRKLFEETFEAVRGYFCAIFQKLFGGGRADLTLEDPSNPLESGVDVAARPPGKELKSLSLMSGGEKSLTCVALLLAIFQYRTSPICILDEVDAALDEGNVSRFTNALMDFVPTTQFLLVTHSKKTMSSAKAIYGVTMEDSGVSKILSVHFDDVGEDGEILVKSRTPVAERPRLMRDDAA
ncbi:MAG: chromosome segregation protein SMC [Thermoguttaceae bacterium]|nr:chromosome segregation protein SMC [Thermoguttaceae bacterium]